MEYLKLILNSLKTENSLKLTYRYKFSRPEVLALEVIS